MCEIKKREEKGKKKKHLGGFLPYLYQELSVVLNHSCILLLGQPPTAASAFSFEIPQLLCGVFS